MSDNKDYSPREIESDIERERAALGSTLDDLQERFSLDAIVRQIGEGLKDNGADIGRSVSRSVKDNPLALTLTGVGLAWLIMGQGRSKQSEHTALPAPRSADYGVPAQYDANRGMSASRTGTTGTAYGSGTSYTGRSTDDYDAGETSATSPGFGDRIVGAGQSASGRLHSAGSSVKSGAQGMGAAVSDRAGRLREGMSSARSKASQQLHDRQARMRTSAQALRARVSHGLEDLSQESRDRVLRARHAAIEARAHAEEKARDYGARATDFYDQQPLVVGALALAVGAALGGLLPRTDREDQLFGQESDRLMDEAERIFSEEREKLSAVAGAAKSEAQKIASETSQEADRKSPDGAKMVDDVADRVEKAGERIADATRREAEKQDLGGSAKKS